MNKKLKIPLLIFSAILTVAVVIFIFTIIHNYIPKNVSHIRPYLGIIDKELVVNQEAVLVENNSVFTDRYSMEMYDLGFIDLKSTKHVIIERGSLLKFRKAFETNNFVSGERFVYLLGTLQNKRSRQTTTIVYQWAHFKKVCVEGPCNYWEFRQAPWQQ